MDVRGLAVAHDDAMEITLSNGDRSTKVMSAPLTRTSSGRIALTVAAVPTGMNAGVRISPRPIAMTPARAAPSVAAIVKSNRVTGRA
jgi:hypothetical protein